MYKIRVIIIICLMMFSIISVSVGDRPSYSFSDEVFKDLPVFPDDFYEIRQVFVEQNIFASQFGNNYLQPEMLPEWGFWAEKVYGNDSIRFGSYGIFCFPSEFHISNVSGGDSFIVSTLIYSNYGIKFYQGIGIDFEHSDYVNVSLLHPDSKDILLPPTHPYFYDGWMRIIELNVSVEKTGSYIINLTEDKPSDEFHNLWSELYGDSYVTGMSMLSMQTPRLQVFIFPPTPEESVVGGSNIFFDFFYVLFFFILGLLFVIWYIYVRRKKVSEETE